jgi:hypothetical protein
MYKDTSQAYCGAYKEIYLNGFALWDHPQKCLNFEPFVRICIRGLYLMCLGLVWAGFVFVSVNRFLYKLWRCVPDITWNRDRDKCTRLQPLLIPLTDPPVCQPYSEPSIYRHYELQHGISINSNRIRVNLTIV